MPARRGWSGKGVPYRPGELKAVALDSEGKAVASSLMRTAEEPAALRLSADRAVFAAGGEDLICVTVEAVDRNGTPHPLSALPVSFRTEGAGALAALCNGDATSLEVFTGNSMRLFSGKCAAFLRAGETPGILTLTAEAPACPPQSSPSKPNDRTDHSTRERKSRSRGFDGLLKNPPAPLPRERGRGP